MFNKKITLTIAGCDLTFDVNAVAYNGYINEMSMTSKVIPAVNFLKKTIVKDDADALKKITSENPGATLQIAGVLVSEYAPDLEIEVKK